VTARLFAEFQPGFPGWFLSLVVHLGLVLQDIRFYSFRFGNQGMAKKRKSKKKKSSSNNKKRCPHCGDGPETFRFMENIFNFDVDLARKITSDGRQPIELEPDDVEYSVDISRIYPEHVKHVNPEYPGIIAHIWYPEPDGNVLHGHVLIDGHHRAARCLKDDLQFRVHILSEDESRSVLLTGPDIDEILSQIDQDGQMIRLLDPEKLLATTETEKLHKIPQTA
jgi:hypothetical protein